MNYEEDITFLFSDLYHQIFDPLTWIILSISSLIYVLLLFIVIKKSPREMRVYKWYLLINHTFSFAFELILGFTHPRFLLPYVAITSGKAKNIGL